MSNIFEFFSIEMYVWLKFQICIFASALRSLNCLGDIPGIFLKSSIKSSSGIKSTSIHYFVYIEIVILIYQKFCLIDAIRIDKVAVVCLSVSCNGRRNILFVAFDYFGCFGKRNIGVGIDFIIFEYTQKLFKNIFQIILFLFIGILMFSFHKVNV